MADFRQDVTPKTYEQLSLDVGLGVMPAEVAWSDEAGDESFLVRPSFGDRLREFSMGESPHDRLQAVGTSALSVQELLVLLLGTEVGQRLLSWLGAGGADPLGALREVMVEELVTVPGIGLVKATQLVAAIELGKRIFLPRPGRQLVLSDPGLVAEALAPDLMWRSQECFAVVLLDVKHQLLGIQIVTIGTVTETLAHPREVFRQAIRRGATRIIIAHNHPSGQVEPSSEDLALTKQFLQAAAVLGIPLLDHLILGAGHYCSLRSTTSLWGEYAQE